MAVDDFESPHDSRWLLLSGLWGIYASFGLVSASLAPLIGPIMSELGLSRAQMGMALGAWPLVYIGSALPAGTLVDRWGVRKSLALGGLLIGASGALRAVATDHLSLFLAVAVFGLGGPLVSVGAPKLISSCFGERERGSAIGLYMTGPAFGGAFALSATNAWLLPLLGGGWRRVLLFHAAICVAAVGIWWRLSRNESVPEPSRGAGDLAPWRSFAELLRLRGVHWCLVFGVGAFLYSHGLTNWLPEILQTQGMTASRAGAWAALDTAVGVPAAILVPRLAVPERRTLVLASACAGGALGALLLERGAVFPALVLIGVAKASMVPVTLLALIEARGVDVSRMGAASGLFFTFAEAGGVTGPWIVGAIADVGGFGTAILAWAGVAAALALLSPILSGHSNRASEPASQSASNRVLPG